MKYNIEKKKIPAPVTFWLREYRAFLRKGEFANVPIRLFEGYIMITHLRYIMDNDLLRNYNINTQYAIKRKLDQYDGVEWFYGCPTRKPKKPFNYLSKIYKNDQSPEDVSSS